MAKQDVDNAMMYSQGHFKDINRLKRRFLFTVLPRVEKEVLLF